MSRDRGRAYREPGRQGPDGGELTFQGEGGAALHRRLVLRALNGGGVFPDPGGVVTWWGKEAESALGGLPRGVGGSAVSRGHFCKSLQPGGS